MTKAEALTHLRAMGTAQNRKVYARHGVRGEQFGVSYANLGKLRKAIMIDQSLAEELWATGNHDARVLATMIADPTKMTLRKLEAWARVLDSYVVTDALSDLAARSPEARRCMKKWIGARGEWVGAAGWQVLARLAATDGELSTRDLEPYLEMIEAGIHGSKNRVRHAMNTALIALGIRSAELEKKALAAARRIGRVEVGHGETGCKTPDAASYIRKAAERKRTRKRTRSRVTA